MSSLEQQINEIKSSTILSSFDDKITLLQWLKKLEQAIKESNIKFLDYVKINELANNQIQIEMSFDGLKVYSNAVNVLSQTDDAVTEGSTLPVQSGAVYTEINTINNELTNIDGRLDTLENAPKLYSHNIEISNVMQGTYAYMFIINIINYNSNSYKGLNLIDIINEFFTNGKAVICSGNFKKENEEGLFNASYLKYDGSSLMLWILNSNNQYTAIQLSQSNNTYFKIYEDIVNEL